MRSICIRDLGNGDQAAASLPAGASTIAQASLAAAVYRHSCQRRPSGDLHQPRLRRRDQAAANLLPVSCHRRTLTSPRSAKRPRDVRFHSAARL
jgi:hypothetical protein